jgi:hypothetical protein
LQREIASQLGISSARVSLLLTALRIEILEQPAVNGR